VVSPGRFAQASCTGSAKPPVSVTLTLKLKLLPAPTEKLPGVTDSVNALPGIAFTTCDSTALVVADTAVLPP
jgi:hypothetical protein